MLVPDSEMSEATFNQLFISNDYALQKVSNYQFSEVFDDENMVCTEQINQITMSKDGEMYKAQLTNVQEDVKSLTDGKTYFSTMAGLPNEPYKTSDVEKQWNKTAPQDLTESISVVRGKWGSFVGVGVPDGSEDADGNISIPYKYGDVFNVKMANYYSDEESAIELDFQRRFTTAEAYSAISHRTELTDSIDCYRGDCFISMFTHRMHRNFIDPELPTNDKIVDPACWAKNYAVRCTATIVEATHSNLTSDNSGWYIPAPSDAKEAATSIALGILTGNIGILVQGIKRLKQSKERKDSATEQNNYANEIVQAFEVYTGKQQDKVYHWDPDEQQWYFIDEENDNKKVLVGPTYTSDTSLATFMKNNQIKKVNPKEQEANSGFNIKALFKADDKWDLRGLAALNRADVNAVGLGQWITFPICSAKNLAMRDVDYSNPTEQSAFNRKRSFFPLQAKDPHCPLRDSNIINHAASISIPHKHYYGMPNVPFIKQEYFTRVINSLRDSAASITNEFKVMLENAYRDYTKIHGSITKLMPLGTSILVVFQHGLGLLRLGDTMPKAQDATEYLPAEVVMLSTTYGSIWKDSVIQGDGYIYGVDSVAKAIWQVDNQGNPKVISTLKVEKFLIDNLEMSEFTLTPYVGRVNIKSHYNAFKHDVIFTYYNDIPKYHYELPAGYDDSIYSIDEDGYITKDDFRISKLGDYVKAKKIYDSWERGKSWSLCWSEPLQVFTTFYDWIPLESANIDNIWFSFDREAANELIEAEPQSLTSIISTNGIDLTTYTNEKYQKHLIDKAFSGYIPVVTNKSAYGTRLGFLSFPVTLVPGNLFGISFYIKGEPDSKVNIKFEDRGSSLYKYELDTTGDWQLFTTFLKTNDTYNLQDLYCSVDVAGHDVQLTGAIIKNLDEDKGTKLDEKLYNSWNLDVDKSTIKTESLAGEIKFIFRTDKISDDKYYYMRDLGNSLKLWKHGQAGVYDNQGKIKPTHWYGKQHEFNFEFIAREDAFHKIFTNLQMVSNKAEPHKFEFEVVGEVYDWHEHKQVIKWINDKAKENNQSLDYWYKIVLTTSYEDLHTMYDDFPEIFENKALKYRFQKLPYMKMEISNWTGTKGQPEYYMRDPRINKHSDNSSDTTLVFDERLNEFRVHTEQLGNNMRKYGRTRGNMEYLEDLWKVEIRPVAFRYAYMQGDELAFTQLQETRLRDKYIKIKVRYTGEDLAVIQAIGTMFDYSFA